MGKQSGMMAKLQQRHDMELKITRHVTRQEMADMAAIALHRAFGFGEERNKRFMDALNEVINDAADMVNNDTKDGMFTIARFEGCLQEACGKYYVPRKERYKP